MSRPLRIDYPNAWHHVMNRARRGTDLFVNKADYQQFIDLLQETAELFNVNVAAICLMPTHYHLMVQTPAANLSRFMRHLNGVYTQKYNVVHGRTGLYFADDINRFWWMLTAMFCNWFAISTVIL